MQNCKNHSICYIIYCMWCCYLVEICFDLNQVCCVMFSCFVPFIFFKCSFMKHSDFFLINNQLSCNFKMFNDAGSQLWKTFWLDQSQNNYIVKNWKINSVILHVCTNRTYLQIWLWNLLLILQNLFLGEPIFRIGYLGLFSTKPRFCHHKIWNFETWDRW